MQSALVQARVQARPAAAAGASRAPASRVRSVAVYAVQDLQGKVVSTAMNQSVVVAVERLSTHDQYFKRVRITKKYIAHADGSVPCSVGDYVRIEGCRPLSKNKRFKLAEVIRKSE